MSYLISIKEKLKQISLIYRINGFVKTLLFKYQWGRIKKLYAEKILYSGYSYVQKEEERKFLSCALQRSSTKFPLRSRKLHIFWVGANEDQDKTGFFQALNRIGKVTSFINSAGEYGLRYSAGATFDKVVRSQNGLSIIKQVTQAHQRDKIDILIGQMWANYVPVECLEAVQNLGIVVVNISMDDRLPTHWSTRGGVRLGSIGLVSGLDMVLTTSPEVCEWYGVEGCPAIFWPLASDPTLFARLPSDNVNIDVLFVGNRYGIRGKLVRELIKAGVDVHCYGRGWKNGYVDFHENTRLSRQAKIILGVGTVSYCDDVYTLKLRDFDALMTGALYITHRNPDLCQLFEEGREIEFYSSPQELVSKIIFFLENPEEREIIGKAGALKAKAAHTWDVRLKDTFKQLGLI